MDNTKVVLKLTQEQEDFFRSHFNVSSGGGVSGQFSFKKTPGAEDGEYEVEYIAPLLKDLLKNYPGTFDAYQSSIASAIVAEVKRQEIPLSDEKLREMSNNSAKQFLQLLVGQNMTPSVPEKQGLVGKVIDKLTGRKKKVV